MTGVHYFTLPLSCPKCAGPVEQQAQSKPVSFRVSCVVRCVDCAHEVLVVCSLSAVPRPDAEAKKFHMRQKRAAAK